MNRKVVMRFPILSCCVSVIFFSSGCDFEQDYRNRNPETSELTITEEAYPETKTISIPTPEKPSKSKLVRADAASLWKSGARSLFLDQRAEGIGDILTITIDIDDQAQLKNTSSRSRNGNEEVNDPEFLGYGSQIEKLFPGLTKADFPTSGKIIDLSSAGSLGGEGAIRRNESIKLIIAAMIIQKLPNNNFVIAGRQEVKVNNELRELRVAGIIRQEDIGSNNSISYDKIAEARITYGGKGQISQVQKPRYGTDLLDILLPY